MKALPIIRHLIYTPADVRNELMISNERPSPFKGLPQMQPRPPVQEDTLKSGQVQIERKTIAFILKENPRGRFLRISEDSGGRRNAIIIPSTGLAEFQKLLEEMIKASNELPPTNLPET
jgi:hypothetical protein